MKAFKKLGRMHVSARAYTRSCRGSTVEFVLVFPFLFLFFIFVVDACNWLADWRQATRLAESIVRTAHALDRKIVDQDVRPLNDDDIRLLRNIAARMQVQFPDGRNSVWLGRYVRPQSPAPSAQPPTVQPIVQLLPGGLTDPNNRGIVLIGEETDVVDRNRLVAEAIEPIALAGEIFYAVEVRFTRQLLSPVPQRLERLQYSVRFVQ
jgi:hypothetical protein